MEPHGLVGAILAHPKTALCSHSSSHSEWGVFCVLSHQIRARLESLLFRLRSDRGCGVTQRAQETQNCTDWPREDPELAKCWTRGEHPRVRGVRQQIGQVQHEAEEVTALLRNEKLMHSDKWCFISTPMQEEECACAPSVRVHRVPEGFYIENQTGKT